MRDEQARAHPGAARSAQEVGGGFSVGQLTEGGAAVFADMDANIRDQSERVARMVSSSHIPFGHLDRFLPLAVLDTSEEDSVATS